MKLDKHHHLIVGIDYIVSPNCDDRPNGQQAEVVIVHAISLPPEQFGGPYIEQLFCNQLNPADHPYFEEIKNHKVSAHLLIRRNGELIQFVPFNRRAWHAGESECEGRKSVNDFSIGIELEGSDREVFETVQYERLAEVVQILIQNYSLLSRQRIYGHSDIAPGRKTDPGPYFDWNYFARVCK